VKQVLQNRSGETVVRDVPAPPCPPAGVLVRNLYSAISAGTERARVEGGGKSLLARARERPDLVRTVIERTMREGLRSTRDAVSRKLGEEMPSGYSSAGRVLEVGAAVSGLSPGDLVACAGVGHANHAEVVAVPRNLVARVPDGVSLPAASLTTIAAIALHGIRLADVRLDERVAVVGLGIVGQITCRLLGAAGAEVFALDLDAARVAQAVAGGADHGILVGDEAARRVAARSHGHGVDHAIVTAAAGTPDPLLLGAEVARDRGSLTLVGAVPIELPREPLFAKELRFSVSRSYGPGRYDPDYERHGVDYPPAYVRWTEQRNMEAVLDLQARGRLTFEDLVDEVIDVDDSARAYDRLVGSSEARPRGALVLAYPERGADEAPPLEAPVPAPVRRPAAALSPDAPALGLIGPGAFATGVLVPAFTAAGARPEVVGGGSGPSAAAAQRDLGFARTAPSAEAVLADPGVDFVVIGTRHADHAYLAQRGLEQGKHVFVEKPLALTEAELEDVLAAAARGPGILAVGFNRRFSPMLVALRDFLARSESPVTATYRVSAGAIDPTNWVHDLTQGGGRILGEVCHFVDSLTFLAGSPAVEVHAVGHGGEDTALQARDNLVVTLAFADGSAGSIAYVAEGAPGIGKERVEAFARGRVGVLDDYRTLDLHAGSEHDAQRLREADKGHRAEAEAFLAGARAGRAPVALDELANVSLATLAVVESLRTGRPVRVA
jgi:predicted dehydrogenase/threonine dehydrogenase-like Zn-dependent dehydrogenase